MGLTIDFPATLLRGIKKALLRNRIIAWTAFFIALAAGLICALAWHDAMYFARAGSLGVIVGVVFARWRFLALRKAERKLERALRNPEQWFVESVRKRFPGLNVTQSDNPTTFTSEQVQSSIEPLIGEVDRITFRDESAIIVISTVVWGFGDLILQKLLTGWFPDPAQAWLALATEALKSALQSPMVLH